MEYTTKKDIHIVDIIKTKQFLLAFLQPCNLITTQSQDLSHFDVNSSLSYAQKQLGAAHFHVLCTDDHFPNDHQLPLGSFRNKKKLPLGSSLNHIILRDVFSRSTCNISYEFKCRLTLQTNTSLYIVFCPHSHASWELPKCHLSQNCSKSSTFNFEVLME